MQEEIVTWPYTPPSEILMSTYETSNVHLSLQKLDECARLWRLQIDQQLASWVREGWRPKYLIDGTIFESHIESRKPTLWTTVSTRGKAKPLSYLVITGAKVVMLKG